MSDILTDQQVVRALRERVNQSTQRRVAEELKLSPAFVCDILKGRRLVTERLARKMGYKRVVRYERVA